MSDFKIQKKHLDEKTGVPLLHLLPPQFVEDAFFDAVRFFKDGDNDIDMQRMKGQILVAKKVIDHFVDGRESVVIQAPTGFGKSLMAFFMTKFFSILSRNGGLDADDSLDSCQSYLLTSNKFLQEQYDRDIKHFNFGNYHMLKGQANYQCTVNGKSFIEKACGDLTVGQIQRDANWKTCALKCPYIVARKKAIGAETTVFNYSYWLTQMNKVFPMLGPRAPFKPRVLTVFDESHVLGDLVQDMFATELNMTTLIRRSNSYFNLLDVQSPESARYPEQTIRQALSHLEEIERNIDTNELVYGKLVDFHKEIHTIAKAFNGPFSALLNTLPEDENGEPILNKEQKTLAKFNAFLFETVENIEANLDLYKSLGISTMVCSVNQNRTSKTVKPVEGYGSSANSTLVLQCTNESELCKVACHQYSVYSIFMSATLGNTDDYAVQTGVTNYATIDVPQVFDYTESPIYKVTPMLSMNYKNKHANKPKMMERAIDIVNNHEGQRGLIHTGNYELMRALRDMNHPRLLFYDNSQEKEEIIKLLEQRPDAVVCGPSLVEGVDLKDDLCRFMIFLKVPYSSLADRLTKKKMAVYPNWYGWKTMCQVLQGLGRGIRNDKDWCITYLLDDGFNGFFYRTPLPTWVAQRLKLTKSSKIGVEYDPDAMMDDW